MLCRNPVEWKGGTYPGHHSSCCNISRENSEKEDCTERKANAHFVELSAAMQTQRLVYWAEPTDHVRKKVEANS